MTVDTPRFPATATHAEAEAAIFRAHAMRAAWFGMAARHVASTLHTAFGALFSRGTAKAQAQRAFS